MSRWLLCLLLLGALPVCQVVQAATVTWQSYSDVARTIQSDNFTTFGCVVYMKATGLVGNKTYRVIFKDGMGDTVSTQDLQSNKAGELLPQVRPADWSTSDPGLWQAELWKTQPLQLQATDTFTVAPSAIPEIPNVIAGMFVVGACGLIWHKLRGRK